jgi:cobalt-zinc-cadmium efflux system protein
VHERTRGSAHDAHENCAHGAAVDALRAGRPDVMRPLTWALVLTAGFMVAEVVGGLLSNSLALLADAGHMFTDAGALALALGVAVYNARRSGQSDQQLRRREAWAAGVNAAVLLIVSAGIVLEAITRLRAPEAVATGTMLVIALLGLAVNVLAALILRPVAGSNLNARGAYLHVLGDLLGSVGTIAAALIIRATGNPIADPIASLLVCLLIVRAAGALMSESAAVIRSSSAPG